MRPSVRQTSSHDLRPAHRGRDHVSIAGAVVLAAGIAPWPAQPARAATTGMVSVLGSDYYNSHGARPAISADGRYVAFVSGSVALVSGDTNGLQDVFVKDLQTDTIERVSVSSGGAETNAHCLAPAISADGRYVVFQTEASNLVPGDTNGQSDVFLRDRQTGTTELVSMSSTEVQGNGASGEALSAISADGRFVAFDSWASNLVSGDPNGLQDVFLRDRQAGTTELVNLSSTGAQATNGISYWPAMSADGRFVAFTSTVNHFDPSDTNGLSDVYVRDRQSGTTVRASSDSAGLNGDCALHPSISADGRFVAFHGCANLVPGDTNGVADVFVKDLQTGTIERVSVDSNGAEANDYSNNPVISADGRFLAFSSNASNLVPGDTNGLPDVFVHDRQSATTELVSVSSTGTQGNFESGGSTGVNAIAINADGAFVAFTSRADLVPNDINNGADVYIRVRDVNQPPVAACGQNVTAECTSAAGAVVALDGSASFDPDGTTLLFHWDVSDLSVELDDPESATPSGMFPVGITMATLTVTDVLGGVDTCDVLVTVQDTIPPEVMCTTNVASLWPPNHTMRNVQIMVVATDVCQEPGEILPLIVQVRSDEPDNAIGNGDGNTTGDVNFQDGYTAPVNVTSLLTYNATQGAWIGTIQLRAERAGSGDGRAYTIDAMAFDSQNHVAIASCVVVVPHGQND